MRRSTLVLITAMAVAAGATGAEPSVVFSDGAPAADAVTATDGRGATWARLGFGAPVPTTTTVDGSLRLPALTVAKLVVLDRSTGEVVAGGSLLWADPDAPAMLVRSQWTSDAGHLDLVCRGGERVTISAPGYAPAASRLQADGRRHAVNLEPLGSLTLRLEPAVEAEAWLARSDEVNVTTLFMNVAEKHAIAGDGVLRVEDLEREAAYVGVVVPPGRAPVVGSFQGLPLDLELPLDDGLGVSGVVRDDRGAPLAGARIETQGKIAELDSFRYRQRAVTSQDGLFTVGGLLAGLVRVRACAEGRACSETTVEVGDATAPEPIELTLVPGRNLTLQVQNEIGERIPEAILYFNDRVYQTDTAGQVGIEGLVNRETVAVQIFGGGFGMWEGSFTADRDLVVIMVPGGAAIEQQVLVARRYEADEVTVRWQAYHPNGREGKSGNGRWDAENAIARASGLEAGSYDLAVRLPGMATLRSEKIEVALGEQAVLAPAVPDYGLAIAGRVLDAETLQPVPGAQVSCEPGSPAVFRAPHKVESVPSAATDSDGVFLLEGLDPGQCRAIVRASGYATWRLDGAEPDETGYDIGDIELDAGMTIIGRVIDRGSRPITGAVVEVREDAPFAYFSETAVRTDHDGYFRAERLPVGRWKVTAEHGQETARDTVEGGPRDTVEVELKLGGIRIEGEVWLGDRRAMGGTLVLTNNQSQPGGVVVMMQRVTDDRQFFGVDEQPLKFTVNSQGLFAGSGLAPGRYFASYTSLDPGAAPVSKVIDVPYVETYQCAIQYADATVNGIVLDTDGLPVAGASVTASAGDGIQELTAYTDAEGQFIVQGLEPGTAVLTADHTEYSPSVPAELSLRDGSAEGPVVLELQPPDGASVMLAVNAAAGSAGGAPVYLVGPQTSTGFTDSGGLATFSGITAGSYRPCGFAYGGATGCGQALMVDDGERVQANLDLGVGGYVDVYLGSAKGLAAPTAAKNRRGPDVRVMTTDGVDLSSLLFMASPPQPTSGGVRIGPLQADDYIIAVTTESGSRQGQIRVEEGVPVELELH